MPISIAKNFKQSQGGLCPKVGATWVPRHRGPPAIVLQGGLAEGALFFYAGCDIRFVGFDRSPQRFHVRIQSCVFFIGKKIAFRPWHLAAVVPQIPRILQQFELRSVRTSRTSEISCQLPKTTSLTGISFVISCQVDCARLCQIMPYTILKPVLELLVACSAPGVP